jgi:hypothetical protein
MRHYFGGTFYCTNLHSIFQLIRCHHQTSSRLVSMLLFILTSSTHMLSIDEVSFRLSTSCSERHSYYVVCVSVQVKNKDKAVPYQARCSPEGSRRFRLRDFHDIRHVQVVRSSASRTGRLYPQECSWYSFSLGAESTPGPWYGRKEICH